MSFRPPTLAGFVFESNAGANMLRLFAYTGGVTNGR